MALEAEHHDVWTLQLPRIGGAMGYMAADAAPSIGRWVGENLREPLLAMAVDTGPAVGTEDRSCDGVVSVNKVAGEAVKWFEPISMGKGKGEQDFDILVACDAPVP